MIMYCGKQSKAGNATAECDANRESSNGDLVDRIEEQASLLSRQLLKNNGVGSWGGQCTYPSGAVDD
eukprot:gene14501-9620_t